VHIIFLFLDGVGIGAMNPDANPFFQARLPNLRSMLGGALPHRQSARISSDAAELVPLNSTLGVPGLPQSGTGQAALFTGVNAARKIGKHFGPHPTTTLHSLLREKNIFRELKTAGKSVRFVNAFPKQFFDYVDSGTRRLTVTTLSCRYADVPLLGADDLRRNDAVSADLTRGRWPDLGYPELHAVTPRESGRDLSRIALRYDFTLFEFWLTDVAGHSRDMTKAVEILERFDAFLGGVMEEFDAASTLLILTSDHGNIEDLTTKSHTRNPVPCLALGRKHREFLTGVKNLTHITPSIVRMLQ
jgi:2,3-bisphosphoglycerate-independent phosphoglycerate mutase